jgi:ABC-type polysaccharide/polyol phosphate transport system ATPase subunit
MAEELITVEGLSKKFCRGLKRSLWYGLTDLGSELIGRRDDAARLRADEFWAVKDVSFALKRGECLGLIGRNGAGKTTILRMLNGLIKPDQGRIVMRGRVGALIALGAGFNPILTGRENIYVAASVLGIPRKEIDAKFDDIVAFAELPEFIDSPVQSYSSGMSVRLGFAVATALEPDVLLLDEVLAVGDASFRSKCIRRIGALLSNSAVILVSHDAWSIRRICDAVLWLKNGTAAFHGDTETGMQRYSESAISTAPEPRIISAPSITNVEHRSQTITVHQPDGGEAVHVDITVSFLSDRSSKVGLCLGNVTTVDEMVVGQFNFRPWVVDFECGMNTIEFRVANLQLARGSYTLTLAIYDESRKDLLLNIRHFVQLDCVGNIRYGPHYAVATEPLRGGSGASGHFRATARAGK